MYSLDVCMTLSQRLNTITMLVLSMWNCISGTQRECKCVHCGDGWFPFRKISVL